MRLLWSDILAWWDRVELWLSTLAFPLQIAIMLVVFVPLSYGLARLNIMASNAIVSPRLIATARRRDDAVEEELHDDA